MLRSAGTPGSPNSVVHHVGRKSGRAYQTPVVAVPADDGFVIALPYGPKTEWLVNVQAVGRATIACDGRTYDVDRPEVVNIDEVSEHFAPKEQRRHRQFNVRAALRVRTVGDRAARSLVS